jgi:hypothetical protein
MQSAFVGKVAVFGKATSVAKAQRNAKNRIVCGAFDEELIANAVRGGACSLDRSDVADSVQWHRHVQRIYVALGCGDTGFL